MGLYYVLRRGNINIWVIGRLRLVSDWQLSYFMSPDSALIVWRSSLLSVSLVKFSNVTWVNYRGTLVNIHMTAPFSWGHELTFIYFSPELARARPGYGCQNYHYPDLCQYWEYSRQWHSEESFLFRYDKLSFLVGFSPGMGYNLCLWQRGS